MYQTKNFIIHRVTEQDIAERVYWEDNKKCKTAGFNVKKIVAHMQFECMQEESDGMEVGIIDAHDHFE